MPEPTTSALPATFQEAQPFKPRQLIAVSGIGGTTNAGFLPAVRKEAPNATLIPLRGTGHGIKQMGVNTARQQILNAIQPYTTNKEPVTIMGHSLGGSLLSNIQDELGTNRPPNMEFSFIDPPALPRLATPPIRGLFPTADAVSQAQKAGIMNKPETINWTSGQSTKEQHSPWEFPNSPGNVERLDWFKDFIRKRAGTNDVNRP